ncbi:sun domain containing protein [Grosmannia clavigera kw1407]|uniref:Sun domain containing protein n=1 Tax=Grosmannia clavigera (strain kw1407 / UAMH 11150) TaxID=655863 RepID=F0XD98_GROCL|nr:sun domain containing protein [Grosmannia clavigera kw1407]EFX04299.1 sun domain containing protein [Grosmannia clavigera kw1407]
MKGLANIAVAAAFVASVAADSHGHHHARRLAQGSPVAKRAATVAYETAYVYADGSPVSTDEAHECIDDGSCIVLGTATPVYTSPAPTSTSTSSLSTKEAQEFFESKITSSSTSSWSTSTAWTSTSTSTSTSSFSTSTSTSWSSTSTSWSSTSTSSSSTWSTSTISSTSSSASAAASSSSSSTTTVSGSGTKFPSGTVKCSEFPSAYGAVAVDWIGLGGWASIQTTGSWTPGSLISDIVEAVSGGCTEGSFCSYACPAGQTKAQWPTTSQGATGQSIGGLWCNSDGYLELTNDNFDTLCQDGLGGITIKNELSDEVAVCGTNYPGNEMMNIPVLAGAGETVTLTNMNAKTGYEWEGKYTSGQYYVNNKGVTLEQGCVWTSADYPDSAGNWAPVNIGAGTDIYGVTYISIFPNTPTSSAELDFDIEITGDINGDCYLKSGSYYGGGSGCTTSLTTGGSAVIKFKKYGS